MIGGEKGRDERIGLRLENVLDSHVKTGLFLLEVLYPTHLAPPRREVVFDALRREDAVAVIRDDDEETASATFRQVIDRRKDVLLRNAAHAECEVIRHAALVHRVVEKRHTQFVHDRPDGLPPNRRAAADQDACATV